MSDLSHLVTRAAAACSRFSTYAAQPFIDADRFRELEQADHEARRAVRAKLAEMRVDPRMLAGVLS